MVKQNGFTLIEILIVFAIIAIVATLFISACQDAQDARNGNDETLEEMIDMSETINGAPTEYIRNDRRNSGDFKLVRHDDGTLWGCIVKSGNCYKVTE